jgi:hypothetical protein
MFNHQDTLRTGSWQVINSERVGPLTVCCRSKSPDRSIGICARPPRPPSSTTLAMSTPSRRTTADSLFSERRAASKRLFLRETCSTTRGVQPSLPLPPLPLLTPSRLLAPDPLARLPDRLSQQLSREQREFPRACRGAPEGVPGPGPHLHPCCGCLPRSGAVLRGVGPHVPPLSRGYCRGDSDKEVPRHFLFQLADLAQTQLEAGEVRMEGIDRLR